MSAAPEATSGIVNRSLPGDRVRSHRAAATLAWTTALISIALVVVDLWFGNKNRLVALTVSTDPTIVGMAAIGALVASRRPRNPIGWIVCGIGLLGSVGQFAWSYGYYGLSVASPSTPFALQSLWLGQWIWLVGLGIGLPALILRFPNGRVARQLSFVDWLAVGGTAALVLASGLKPGAIDVRSTVPNPYGIAGADAWLELLRWLGYTAVATAIVAATVALALRIRGSQGDEHEQVKWIATAAAVMAVALIGGFARQAFAGENLYDALVPFLVSTVTLPIAIGVAVLKYRLYEINLIINRALVYGTLTAGLAGLYALSLALTQMIVGAAGQRSAAAILLTAFVGTTAFTPAKDRLHKVVDSRFGVADPVAYLDSLRAQVEVVAQVLDPHRIARRLVDDLATKYSAHYVSLSLKNEVGMVPFHTSGNLTDRVALAIPVHSRGREVGVLSLGERLGGLSYGPRDHQALQSCADAVGDVLGLWRETQPASQVTDK